MTINHIKKCFFNLFIGFPFFKKKHVEIMEEEEKLLELMKIFNENRIDYNNRIWSTLNFFQAIYTALIGATVVSIYSLYDEYIKCTTTISSENELCFPPNIIFPILIILLPILSIIAIYYCGKNFKREQKLLFYEEGQVFKIANYLGLNIQINDKEKKWLDNENWILSDKWRPYYKGTNYQRNEAKTLKAWVETNVEKSSSSELFRELFIAEMIIAAFFILLIIALIIMTSNHLYSQIRFVEHFRNHVFHP